MQKSKEVWAISVGADGLIDGDAARCVGAARSFRGAVSVVRGAGYRVFLCDQPDIRPAHNGTWNIIVRGKR